MSSSEKNLSLEWLIGPVSKATFFHEYWEKRPLVVKRRQADYFASLISLDEVDRVLTTLDQRYPNIKLKNADEDVSAADYTLDDDALDVAKVYQLFEKGSTLVLAFLDTVLPSLASLCHAVESELSFPCQTNVYVTPAGAKGARHHYDTHDVFVLQVTNSKHWTTYETAVELPLRGQDFDSSVHSRGEPALSFELEAGDVAYIPRGLVHDARSGSEVSLHITLGVLAYTWTDLLLELAAEVSLHDAAFRRALPPGFAKSEFDRTEARRILHGLLDQLQEKADLDVILDRFVDAFAGSRPPLLRGQMGQIAALSRLTTESVVGARTNSVRVRANGLSVSADWGGRKITVPVHAAESLRFALTHSRFAVSEIPGLDDSGKLTLVRRLIREGALAILTD